MGFRAQTDDGFLTIICSIIALIEYNLYKLMLYKYTQQKVQPSLLGWAPLRPSLKPPKTLT